MSGKEVKEVLEKTGFTLKEVADRLNISKQLLDSWLKTDDIKVGKLLQICNAVNKSVDFFRRKDNSLYQVSDSAVEYITESKKCIKCDEKERMIKHLEKENERLWQMLSGNKTNNAANCG